MKQYASTLFLSVFLVVVSISTNAQTNSTLRNSVISISGSSVKLDNNMVVHQSLGQQGHIGLASTSNINVRQGFIQPALLNDMLHESENTELQALVFPNPTSEFITLSFDEIVDSEINIYLYDVNGGLVLHKKAHCLFDIQLSVLHLQTGNYFIIAKSESIHFVSQIAILH